VVKSQHIQKYVQMNPRIEFRSLTISRSADEIVNFEKYDMEASLEEIESTETGTKIKFTFTLVSNPKNTRVSIEGLVTIFANQSEASKLLDPDENHIPNIVHIIYQDIFSLVYVISKGFQIPIPAYKLSSIVSSPTAQPIATENNLTEPVAVPEQSIPKEFFAMLDGFEIKSAADYIWAKIGELDAFIQSEKPWESKDEKVITDLVVKLHTIARMLNPFMPETSAKIKELVKANKKPSEPLFLRKD